MTDTSREALIKELRIKSSMMQMGEYIGWGSDTALMIQAADMLEADAQELSNLLARIHRDGGHYEAEHGRGKAVADADLVVSKLNVLSDAQQVAAPATGERAELIAGLREHATFMCIEGAEKQRTLQAANMLEADAPKRDKQWHDTAWQRGFQMGLSTNEGTAQEACDALAAEQAAHRETNRMMTEALMQAEAQQVSVPATDGEIYTAYITATNQTLRPQDERLALKFARAIEAHHGIGEKP